MVQNMNDSQPKIFEWAYFLNKEQRKKEYEKLCEAYNIKKRDWTIKEDFDVLENYIFKQYELCNSVSCIFYFKKVKNQLQSANEKNEVGFITPTSNAEFALYNLNITTPHKGKLFCIFKKNANEKQPWAFKQFISSNDNSEWQRILNSLKNEIPTLDKIGCKDFDPSQIDMTESGISMDHIATRYERFLPSEVIAVFSSASSNTEVDIEKSISKIVEELINYNIMQLNKMQLNKKSECVRSWAITDFVNLTDEIDYNYIPINFLYPFRFLEKVCGVMVFRITNVNNQPSLVTMLDLEQAYKGAKLYDSTFTSSWLNIENIVG